jgi:signal transduction histidine kinase
MPRFLDQFLDRLNYVYRDRSFFVGLKARLLAAIALLVLVFVPLNIAKIAWLRAPALPTRIAVNLIVAAAAVICLRTVFRGRLERAGNELALAMALAVNGTVLLVGAVTAPSHPLSVGIQTFAFGLVILMVAIVFASRRVATAVLAIIVAGHIGYHLLMLRDADPGKAIRYSSDTLLRDGLIATFLIFILGITLVQMIEAAYRRSEETLRQSNSLNRNLERLEHEARVLSERRRELLEIQREFISMVSHEFRTPLTTIQGAQFLLEKLLSESGNLKAPVAANAEKWFGLQASALATLRKLVDQVLMLNRIEHMTGEASLEVLSPADVLAETVARFNDSMDSPRVALRNEVPSGFTASMDSGLVRAAAENLISNGLKYSGLDMPVRVRVYAGPDGWAVEVVDQGRGIPLGDQAKLFRPFFRAGNVGTVPGTGLGLAIVQRAVDFHAGRIEFESRENEGTSFRLHFPVAVHPAADDAAPGRVPHMARERPNE